MLCIVGIDFDHCIEGGKLLEPARSRIAQLRTYTEISVSGEGIHCFARAKPGTTVKYTSTEPGHSVEVYSSIRYFTATGVPFGGTCGTIEPPPQKWMRSSKKRGRRVIQILSTSVARRLQALRTYTSIPH